MSGMHIDNRREGDTLMLRTARKGNREESEMASTAARDLMPGMQVYPDGATVESVAVVGNTAHVVFVGAGSWHGPADHKMITTGGKTMENFTALICGECGNGRYFGGGVFTCTNPICGHSVAPWDVVLDAGERLIAPAFGILGYVTDGEV